MDYSRKGKHLTLADRIAIQMMLDGGSDLNAIAEKLGKSPSTISKEIKARRQLVDRSGKRAFNKQGPVQCPLVRRYPFCCNGCQLAKRCTSNGFSYSAKIADSIYRETLVSSRSGLDMTEEEFTRVDATVSAGVRAGKSPETILLENPDLGISVRSIYRLIEEGKLSVINLDLRRKVSYAPRKKKPVKASDRAIYQGRTFVDYNLYLASHSGVLVAQMDTVEGAKACRKHILTVEFPTIHLMLMRLLDENTPACVYRALGVLSWQLGLSNDRRIVLLTDRGTEFSAPERIEELGFTVFFCDARCPWQKGGIESNHRMLRYCFPKGSDFDSITDEMLSDGESSIASTRRSSLGEATPLDLGEALLGAETIERLGLKKVDANDIDLRPRIGRRRT